MYSCSKSCSEPLYILLALSFCCQIVSRRECFSASCTLGGCWVPWAFLLRRYTVTKGILSRSWLLLICCLPHLFRVKFNRGMFPTYCNLKQLLPRHLSTKISIWLGTLSSIFHCLWFVISGSKATFTLNCCFYPKKIKQGCHQVQNYEYKCFKQAFILILPLKIWQPHGFTFSLEGKSVTLPNVTKTSFMLTSYKILPTYQSGG